MIGELLREARDTAGLSQEEVSSRGRINRSYLSQVERGLKSPTVTMFLRICGAIGASPSAIIAKLEHGEAQRPRKRR